MSKILAVFGATGQQGSSVINHVLSDPELSTLYSLRAITRDINSPKALALKNRNVDVVQADMTDRASLSTALANVHTIYAMTTPSYGPDGFKIEFSAAKAIADVAVEQGAEYIIFSTLPSISEMSGGKSTKASHFDAKAKAEEYIRALSADKKIKSAFFMPGFFMENFAGQVLGPAPNPNGDGYVLSMPTSPQNKLPLIDAVGDTGKFVGAILAEPEKYQGKRFAGASGEWSMEEVATIMTKVTGKNVVYEHAGAEEFSKKVGYGADVYVEIFEVLEEFGYGGKDTAGDIAWAVANARGQPSLLEEYLVAHPLGLE